MTKEIWKQHSCRITQKRCLLEVSNLGRRRVTNLNTQKVYKLDFGAKDGKYKRFGVFGAAHRRIAEVFIPNPENKPEVNHIDGDKTNNHVNNLEWCTTSENTIHAYNTGLRSIKTGAKHHKFGKPDRSRDLRIHRFYNYETDSLVTGIFIHLRENSQTLFGLGSRSVAEIKRGKRKSCKGWIYLGVET